MNETIKLNDLLKMAALVLFGILVYQIHQAIQMNRYIYRYSDVQIDGTTIFTDLNCVDRITGATKMKRSTWGDHWTSWNAVAEARRNKN